MRGRGRRGEEVGECERVGLWVRRAGAATGVKVRWAAGAGGLSARVSALARRKERRGGETYARGLAARAVPIRRRRREVLPRLARRGRGRPEHFFGRGDGRVWCGRRAESDGREEDVGEEDTDDG